MGKQKLIRALIKRAIRDLNCKNWMNSAERYFLSYDFPVHCEYAAYPVALPEALKELMDLSPTQRHHLSQELIKILDTCE